MNASGLLVLLPILIVSATALLVLTAITIKRNYGVVVGITIVGLAAAWASIPAVMQYTPRQVTPLLLADPFGLFYMSLALGAALAVALISLSYFARQPINREEFFLLLLIATLGALVLCSANHFLSLYLGLETLSVALYGLIAYTRNRTGSLEAGMKYLVLAGASSGFLLFGMALIYAQYGRLDFQGLAEAIHLGGVVSLSLLAPGLVLVAAGIAFKLALVPFHMWAADIYEGAPAPVTAFITSASKSSMLAVLLRFFSALGGHYPDSLWIGIAAMAVLSMVLGNLLALRQQNVKRFLAYSSIAHLGYAMIAFLAGGTNGVMAATFYITVYLVTALASFGVLAAISPRERDMDQVNELKGLFWRQPFIAIVMTAALLSLAGIPLTAGFIGKFYLVIAGIHQSLWGLIEVLIVTSVIGLFYYLRVIATMTEVAASATEKSLSPRLSFAAGLALAALFLCILFFGLYPAPITDFLQAICAL